MTIQEVQNLIFGIFDKIFSSVTQAEPGGKPLQQASTTMLSLMKPGMAINPADFKNAWTPGRGGNQDAAVNTTELVNAAPIMSGIYTPSARTISEVYKQILDSVTIPVQPPNPAIDKQLNDANAVLYRQVTITDPDTGEQQTKTVETQLYRDYLDNQAAYSAVRVAYVGSYLEAQKTTTGKNTWPLIASTLQLPVKAAYDKWRSGFADKIEQAIAIMNTSTQNALQKTFDNAKKVLEGYGVVLQDTGTGLAPLIYRSSLLPLDWYGPANNNGWTTYDSASGSSINTSTSEFSKYGGAAGFSMGLFTIGGGVSGSKQSQHVSSETNGLRISFSYTLVSIRRPWMQYSLFSTGGWNLGNLYKKGVVSNGSKNQPPTDKGLPAMPLLPTSFVAVKDVVISAKWSEADFKFIKENISGKGGLAIGPFTVGGTYEHGSTKQTYQSAFANGKITVPGVQIIGFISQVVPFTPPA